MKLFYRLWPFLVIVLLGLTACDSPRSEAQDWADRFPEEITIQREVDPNARSLTSFSSGGDDDETADSEPTAEPTPEVSAEPVFEDVVFWELSDRSELPAEIQSGYGYITLEYTGDDAAEDYTAFVTIMVYGTETAADIAIEQEILDWQLMGARFERERAEGSVFQSALLETGQVLYVQEEKAVFWVRVQPDDPEDGPPDEEALEPLLLTLSAIIENK